MAILESVRELASKLGAETNGRDITDQINKINKHLDETALGGRDIADAVRTYSKNASGGGGGGETFEVKIEYNGDNEVITVNKTYQQIKSEIDLGKTISGTLRIIANSQEFSVNLSNSYIKDFYNGTKAASDAIFIVSEPFLFDYSRDPAYTEECSSINSVAITPDDKIWTSMISMWAPSQET